VPPKRGLRARPGSRGPVRRRPLLRSSSEAAPSKPRTSKRKPQTSEFSSFKPNCDDFAMRVSKLKPKRSEDSILWSQCCLPSKPRSIWLAMMATRQRFEATKSEFSKLAIV
jgi:hypothetical protein